MQYPPYGQNPNDQTTSPYGQYPHQQPGQSPPPSTPPQKRSWFGRQRNITKLGIVGCGSLIGVLFLCTLCGMVASALPKPPVTPTPVVQAMPTHAAITATKKAQPTPKSPTPTATVAPASSGPAVLGATIGDFKAKYGSLNSHSNPGNGQYYFALYGTNQNDLTLQFIYSAHADAIILDAPENHYWNESDAISHCLALLPSDATYQRQMTVSSGDPAMPDIQRVYSVPSLANLFPAKAWTDENGNQTTAGTVGMILSKWTPTTYLNCTVQVGLQG